MADKRNKPDFGIDRTVVAQFDWRLALRRIEHDVRTDFIFAPHTSLLSIPTPLTISSNKYGISWSAVVLHRTFP